MSFWIFLGAAAALSLERACYVWIARAPGQFRRWCARPAVAALGEPVAIVRRLFYGFKLVQLSVFGGWCYLPGAGSLAPGDPEVLALGLGGVLVLAGQALNVTVFYRLGTVGVFYGDRLGYDVTWCREFPFSVLSHPQYVGTVLSIWGFFVAMRFPHEDWILLPVMETLYSWWERTSKTVSVRVTVEPGAFRLPAKPTGPCLMTPARRRQSC